MEHLPLAKICIRTAVLFPRISSTMFFSSVFGGIVGLCNVRNHAQFQVDRLQARFLPIFEGSACGKNYNFVAHMFFAVSINTFAS